MGFLNVILNEDLYDHEFVEKWTNAPFLVRCDTGKLLRESDLAEAGSSANFVAWDTEKGAPAIWDSASAKFKLDGTKPALRGESRLIWSAGRKSTAKRFGTFLRNG